ncbi:MAG TPA: hypothetical protein VMN36_03540 [Verrucomicrobiales bacterium]|nr:hypothetical protein [Verrucomicrobiales bacterium]
MNDFARGYEAAGARLQLDIALSRLTSGQPRTGDPGVEGMMECPPAVEELADFFRRSIRQWKQTAANSALDGSSDSLT